MNLFYNDEEILLKLFYKLYKTTGQLKMPAEFIKNIIKNDYSGDINKFNVVFNKCKNKGWLNSKNLGIGYFNLDGETHFEQNRIYEITKEGILYFESNTIPKKIYDSLDKISNLKKIMIFFIELTLILILILQLFGGL